MKVFIKQVTQEEKENLIRLYAYRWWEIRQKYGIVGDEKSDWQRAEILVRSEYRMENPSR